MRRCLMLMLGLLLAACAAEPPRAPLHDAEALFADAAFAPPPEPIRADEVFALSEPMKRYLRQEVSGFKRAKGAQRGLIEALYRPGQLKLEYDAARTRNAAEAFEARTGNCLSLVIMTAAFARALDLSVTFQSAYEEETWSRAGSIYFRSGHVNIALGPRLADQTIGWGVSPMTIDFLPAEEIRGMRTRVIGEATVIAMYMNNRAAESMVEGRLDEAYWYAREAIVQGPAFLSAYNTLGVIYERRGLLAPAEKVLRHVIAREPDNPRALSNLALVTERQGRSDEAQALRARLAQIEPRPAYYWFERGRAAMQRGDYRAARDDFAREVDRADYNAEFHFWLALANFHLGDVDAARRQLAIAVEQSPSRGEKDLYAAKLAWLKAARMP